MLTHQRNYREGSCIDKMIWLNTSNFAVPLAL
jgi:hypothetical protein